MFSSSLVHTALVSLAILTAGCATTSKALIDEDLEAKNFSIDPEVGVVYLYRGKGVYAAAVQYPVKINGVEVGGTGPGTYFRWELPPGKYQFASHTFESSSIVEIDVEPNELYFIRQGIRMGVADSRITLKQVDMMVGKSKVSSYKLLLSAYPY